VDYDNFVAEDRRLVTLRLLEKAAGYKLNSTVLAMNLERLGHAVSRDQVKTDIAWLAEQGLVKQEVLTEIAVVVASITPRGLDVATGRAIVPGVKRPSPV